MACLRTGDSIASSLNLTAGAGKERDQIAESFESSALHVFAKEFPSAPSKYLLFSLLLEINPSPQLSF